MKRHDSTPPGSWLREQYEKHRAAPRSVTRCAMQQQSPSVWDADTAAFRHDVQGHHPVEDAFAPLDEALGRRTLDVMPPAPVSDYVPQDARELYGDDDGA